MSTKRKAKSAKSSPAGSRRRKPSPPKDWRSEPRELRAFDGAWKDLADRAGGVQALAGLLGISYPTLYRWAVKGDPVSKADRFLVTTIANGFGIKPPPMTKKEGG